jgi:hypothetical protein
MATLHVLAESRGLYSSKSRNDAFTGFLRTRFAPGMLSSSILTYFVDCTYSTSHDRFLEHQTTNATRRDATLESTPKVMSTSQQKMATATASKIPDTNNDHQDNLFMRLPAELRIDIYERVFNASLDNISEKDPLNLSLIHKAILRPLHISRAIRYESLDICIDLANHHIRALEFSLAVENTARVNMPDLSEFAPSFLAGSMLESRPFYQCLARLGETMSLKANKADALYGFLKKMKVPRGSRAYVQRFKRLHLIYRARLRE